MKDFNEKINALGGIQIPASAASGKLATSDADGKIVWQTLAAAGVVGTGDSRLTDSRAPSGAAGGDLSGTYPSPTVAKLNGVAAASYLLATELQEFLAGNGQILSPLAGSTAVAPGANVLRGRLFKADRDYTNPVAAFNVTTLDAADPALEIAILSAVDYSRVATSGAVTGKLTSTGIKTVTIPGSLTRGTRYYIVFATPSATPQVTSTNITANLLDLLGTTAGKRIQIQQSTAYPIPNPAVPTAASATAPIFGLREA